MSVLIVLCFIFVQASDFQKRAQGLLDWLAEGERQLRYQGPIADDEIGIQNQIEQHKVNTNESKLHYVFTMTSFYV